MTRRGALPLAVLLAVATVAGIAAGPASPAAADTRPVVGTDVSRYQCGRPWPQAAFAVVAVNTGVATETNPCLPEQLDLARAVDRGHDADVYVNTADPSPGTASWWPSRDRTRRDAAVHSPYGRCSGDASRACAYVYGVSLAADDVQVRGVRAADVHRWWLDVEVANSWSPHPARNRAVLEGMAHRFRAAGGKVGLYALTHEFHDLIGEVPDSSPLSSLPSWIAGAASLHHAGTVCTRPSLTRGRTLLVQWTTTSGTDRQDLDLACAAFTRRPVPRISGPRRVGGRLRMRTASWRPSPVHLGVRWTRDGMPIAGATGRHYRVRSRDAGHRIRVVVTGTAHGFSRAHRTSRPVRVAG